MSEKRFTIKSIKNNHYQIAENDLKMLSNEVVDLLNELYGQKRFCEEMAQNLKKENEQLKKDKEQLFRDLLESQGSYVRLVCFVRRLGLESDDLAKFEEEIGDNDE